jgi:branched-chain amino acid transport system substrate-binding protein
MGRIRFRAVALLLPVALVAAACAGDDDDDATGGAFEPGELGAVTLEAGDPLKIAAIESITGDTASLGEDQVRAIKIAIDDRGGEILGHEIELQTEDDGCAAEQGTTAAQRVVSDEQIVGVIGTSCSGAAVPAMEILADAGFVMISGSNTSPALTSDLEGTAAESNQPGYFRVAHNDLIQGRAAATYAYETLGATKAATIHDGDPYTQGLADAFGTAFTDLGGEVVLATAINKGDTDMRPVLTEVVAAAPDMVFFPIFQPEADYIVQQAKEFPLLATTDKLMGADGLLSDTFISLPDTEGMYFSGPATPEGSPYEDFVAKYEEANGEKPIQAFHAHAYDSVNILFEAIEKVAVEDGDTVHIDRKALRDALYDTKDYEGITGSLTCDEFGDCADPAIDVVQNTAEQTTIDEVRANILYTYKPS